MQQNDTLRHLVKLTAAAIVSSAALIATPSFAAQATLPSQLNVQAVAATQAIVQNENQAHQKTRAEVYQELVTAEQSGELARIDATYGGN